MSRVHVYSTLRRALGVDAFEVGLGSVGEALAEGARLFGEVFVAEIGDPLAPKAGVLLLVDGRNVHFGQGLDTPLGPDDRLDLFPPSAGG